MKCTFCAQPFIYLLLLISATACLEPGELTPLCDPTAPVVLPECVDAGSNGSADGGADAGDNNSVTDTGTTGMTNNATGGMTNNATTGNTTGGMTNNATGGMTNNATTGSTTGGMTNNATTGSTTGGMTNNATTGGTTGGTTGVECMDTDEPDPEGLDENCDGIDGDIEASIFVAEFGSDNNEGTRGSPMRTLQGAIDKAASDGRTAVLVSPGLYEGPVVLRPGIHLYGGYSFDWSRDLSARPNISGGNPVVSAINITETTIVDNLQINAGRVGELGENSYGVYLRGSTAVRLLRLTVNAGSGANGAPGELGADGDDGFNAQGGDNGCEDDDSFFGLICSDCSRPRSGPGAGSNCGQSGGNGGRPGHPDNGSTESGAGGVGSGATWGAVVAKAAVGAVAPRRSGRASVGP